MECKNHSVLLLSLIKIRTNNSEKCSLSENIFMIHGLINRLR